MAKFTPNGTTVRLQKVITPPTAAVNLVTLSNAKPAIATVATGDIAKFTNGNFVTIAGTGTAVDGMAFRLSSVGTPANSFTLDGSDLSALAAPVSAKGTATPITAAEWLTFCLSKYELSQDAADAIDVSTWCGAESLAGTPQPGEITVGSFMDGSVEAFDEWRKGIKDGISRALHIHPLSKSGYADITMMITPSGRTETWEVNEGVSFEGTAVLNTDAVYVKTP